MTNKFNQILQINLLQLTLATLRLETPDFIRSLIGHVSRRNIAKVSCKKLISSIWLNLFVIIFPLDE